MGRERIPTEVLRPVSNRGSAGVRAESQASFGARGHSVYSVGTFSKFVLGWSEQVLGAQTSRGCEERPHANVSLPTVDPPQGPARHWFPKGHWTKSEGVLIHHNLDGGCYWHLVEVEPRMPLAPNSAQDRQKALSGSKYP